MSHSGGFFPPVMANDTIMIRRLKNISPLMCFPELHLITDALWRDSMLREHIRIISLTIGRHLHHSPIPGEISMKYCAQSRNVNCDRGISDSLALCSRICPWISTYMHPLYLKDRDWKMCKKSNNILERKIDPGASSRCEMCVYFDIYIICFNMCLLRAARSAHIKCIFKSAAAKRTLISHKRNT